MAGGGGFPCSGNFCYSTVNGSAELYDPATGTWSYTGNLSRRAGHTATLLANGQVLVAGGANWGYDIGTFSYLNSAELYDPATGSWRPTASLITIRRGGGAATLLPNGKVMVVGSPNPDERPVAYSAELYDPAAETWSATGAPTILGSLTLLPNGKVLAVSGNAAELYDPATEGWSSAGNLQVIRSAGAATLLRNGKVLVTGTNDSASTAMAELYDPTTGTWSVTGNLNTLRYSDRATLLPDGKVLIAGGANYFSVRTTELYDPDTGAWSLTSDLISGPAKSHGDAIGRR